MQKLVKCIHCGKFNFQPNLKDTEKIRGEIEQIDFMDKKIKIPNLPNSNQLRKMNPAQIKIHEQKFDKVISWKEKATNLILKKLEIIDFILSYNDDDGECASRCKYCRNVNYENTLTEDEFIKRVKAIYKDYISFMNCKEEDLPKDIPIKMRAGGKGVGMYAYDQILKEHYLEFDSSRVQDNLLHQIPLIYHEFTHLYDEYDPVTGGKKYEKSAILFYTEFHASEVEMKKMLGFNNVNDDKDITISSKVYYDNKTFTLIKYFDFYRKSEINRVLIGDNLLDFVPHDFFDIFRSIMYYLGHVSVVKKYLDKDTLKHISNLDGYDEALKKSFDSDDKIYLYEELLPSFKFLEDYLIYSIDSIENTNPFVLEDMIRDAHVKLMMHLPENRQLLETHNRLRKLGLIDNE